MYEIKKTTCHDEFQRVSFVLKARSENDPRHPFASVVHVEHTKTGSRLIATDGHRLHMTEISRKLPAGNYKPTVAKDSITFMEPLAEPITYPKWEQVVPKTTTEQGTLNLEAAGMSKNHAKNAEMTLAFKQFIDATGEIVNLRFLDDLLKTSWVICTQTTKGAIVLKPKATAHKTVAVIMPMQGSKKAA